MSAIPPKAANIIGTLTCFRIWSRRQWQTEKGRCSAAACTTGAAAGERWRIIVAEASTATTLMDSGSYEPVPAPTLTNKRLPWTAPLIRSAYLGSGRR